MKAMITGLALVVVIGVAAYYGLDQLGLTSANAGSGANVRLD